MTSTSCIIGCSAGLKKWRFKKFAGSPPPSLKYADSIPGPIELEFEATSADFLIAAPSARKNWAFASRFSVRASITRSQSASAFGSSFATCTEPIF
jgi:hypothetical protein